LGANEPPREDGRKGKISANDEHAAPGSLRKEPKSKNDYKHAGLADCRKGNQRPVNGGPARQPRIGSAKQEQEESHERAIGNGHVGWKAGQLAERRGRKRKKESADPIEDGGRPQSTTHELSR
jgi:hypothetical protein